MKKNINLLPKKYKMWLKLNRLFYYLVVATAIIFLLSTVTNSVVSARKNEVLQESSYLSELLSRSIFYDENEQLYEFLLERRALLIDIVQLMDGISYVDVEDLRAVFVNIPDGIRTKQVDVDGQIIAFFGVSETRELISKYASYLSTVFADVTLVHLSSITDDGFKFILELCNKI